MATKNKKRGERLEKEVNSYFHKIGIPLLVSAKFLRKYDAGQIDCAYLSRVSEEIVVNILEIKYSLYPTKNQICRLRRSAKLISEITSMSSLVRCINGRDFFLDGF